MTAVKFYKNELGEDSAGDALKVKSVSLARFGEKLGVVTRAELEQLTDTIAFRVGKPYT